MLNKKIALGLFAAFALVSPAAANDIDAAQVNQGIVSNTQASYGSAAFSNNEQKAIVDQFGTSGHGLDVDGASVNQGILSNTQADYGSAAFSNNEQKANIYQTDLYDPYYGQ